MCNTISNATHATTHREVSQEANLLIKTTTGHILSNFVSTIHQYIKNNVYEFTILTGLDTSIQIAAQGGGINRYLSPSVQFTYSTTYG